MEDPKKLVGAYSRIFNCPEGQIVLDDLREMSKIDEQFGHALSHEEFAYRGALQDMFKYINALASNQGE